MSLLSLLVTELKVVVSKRPGLKAKRSCASEASSSILHAAPRFTCITPELKVCLGPIFPGTPCVFVDIDVVLHELSSVLAGMNSLNSRNRQEPGGSSCFPVCPGSFNCFSNIGWSRWCGVPPRESSTRRESFTATGADSGAALEETAK